MVPGLKGIVKFLFTLFPAIRVVVCIRFKRSVTPMRGSVSTWSPMAKGPPPRGPLP